MFHGMKYLIVSLVFSHLGFWSGNLFLIAPFPDLCLLVPYHSVCITKTCPCNVYPLEPHFYIAKLGYAGVYLFFLFLLQNIDCGYSLEFTIYVLSKNKKNIKMFQLNIFIFYNFKNLCILHGHVFIMV